MLSPMQDTTTKRPFYLVLPLLLAPFAGAWSQDVEVAEKNQKSEESVSEESKAGATLEDMFPDKGLFGPSARSAAFSQDGAFAAWLYRPYGERRHGSDLYLMEMASGEVTRLTSVSVLSPFQKSTRKVGKDRLTKAGKQGKSGEEQDAAASEGTWSELGERMKPPLDDDAKKDGGELDQGQLMDTVGEKDADDEKAPRYNGVSSFAWSSQANEMLVSSGGDIYRYVVGSDAGLVRLTKTRESERDAAYLPDGTGFTCLAGDALVRVTFGEHFLDQLDPKLPDGMSMRSYAISPDGKKVVFLASSGSRFGGSSRKVNIATYRDRFMKVREVSRTVSDDPVGDSTTSIYLYRLPDPQFENGELVKVFSQKRTGPRDVLQVPDWAPDSSSVAFSVFEQTSGQVHILEASFPEAPEAPEAADGEEGEEGEEKGDEDKGKVEDKSEDEVVELEATLLYRFLHDGGPNTPRMMQPQYLADSRRMVMLTEQAGFRHPYVLDPLYGTLEPLTNGRFEVYPMELPESRDALFVLATAESPECQDVYRIDLEDGAMTRLTAQAGQYSSAAVSPDGMHVITRYANYGSMPELVHVDVKAGTQVDLTDSHPESTAALLKAVPTFFTFDNRHGQEIHGHMFTPEGLAKDETRPLLVYVYGGPLGSRKDVVLGSYSSSAYLFAEYMTRVHGYITCTIDTRGMSGYGALFEKASFEQVGRPQVEDLVDGVKFLVANHQADADKVGIHGWSFGGFQTQMCMYTEPKVFTCGIAGAGPTEWENYNSWYSTGTIGSSREGKTDLDAYSLLPLAENLEGKLLLVHGMEDSNVLYQDTVRVYAELLEAGKETLVELFLDPTGGHGLGGHIKRLGRYRKYEEFLVRILGGAK